MKKNTLFIILCLLTIQVSFSQTKIDSTKKSEYIPAKIFKQIFRRELTKKDLENSKIIGKDTLILVEINSKFNDKKLKKEYQHKAYMPLRQYKKRYKKAITEEDIANFSYRNGDTLILISNKDFYKKGFSVPYQPKDSTFLEAYKDVVYQKYSVPLEKQKRKNYMRLWRTPIKIYFAKSLDTKYKKAIIETATKVSKEVDSLHISFVDTLEKSNYIIYQIDDTNSYKYEKRLSNNQYIDYYSYWENNKIIETKLELNLLKYKNLSDNTTINYLKQHFFKSLGRFYESSKIPFPSILSTKNSNRKSISKLDIEILKYHYSFGICKGTDLETFEENHKRAKEIFKETGRHMRFKHIDY